MSLYKDLKTELAAYTEYLRQELPPRLFALIEAENQKMVASGLAERALAQGQHIPNFQLPDATGKMVKSIELLARGPLVIVFYRGHWCPYCNLQLRALQEHLGDIKARNATLVAISPQTPDQSLTTSEKHRLEFPVLSDMGNHVARQFNLAYTLSDSIKPVYDAAGVDLKVHNGDDSKELPFAATYVVSKNGAIVGAHRDGDIRVRLTPETILEWLDSRIKEDF